MRFHEPKKIKFGCIAPISLLQKIPEHWNFHLLLAHLLTEPAYVEFYKARKAKGDIIVLDNSAFEFGEALNADLILKLIRESGLQPDYVVAPDYPNQSWAKTVSSTLDFAQRTKDEPFKIAAVPQSLAGDYEGWLEGYSQLINTDQVEMIGMSILGIPNAFAPLTGTDDIMINRLFASKFIVDHQLHVPQGAWQGYKWHHYLGLGSPRELLLQRQIGLIDSNDSSSPMWHGVLGISYDDSYGGLKNGKSPIPVNFHMEDPVLDDEVITSNLEWIADITGMPKP